MYRYSGNFRKCVSGGEDLAGDGVPLIPVRELVTNSWWWKFWQGGTQP